MHDDGERLTAAQRIRLFQIAERLANVGHWRWVVSTDAVYWSDEIFRIHGHAPRSFAPTVASAVDAYHPDDRARVREVLARAVQRKEDFEFELRVLRPDGAERIVRSLGFCEVDAAGEVVEVFGVFQDLTEQRRADLRREDDRRRLQLAADAASLGVWDYDVATERLTWDARMFEIMGVAPEAFGGRLDDWVRRIVPEDVAAYLEAFQSALSSAESMNTVFRIVRETDGLIRHVLAHSVVVRDERGAALQVVGVNRDVTEELQRDLRFQTVLDHLSVACLLCAPDGEVRFANARAASMFGEDASSMLLRRFDELLQAPRATSADEGGSLEWLAARGGEATHWIGRRADGTTFPVQVGVGRVGSGDDLGFVVSVTDLTIVRSLEAQLVQSQRMEATGHLAGGIAHDFNNLLSVVRGHTELLRDAVGADLWAQESLDDILASVARGGSLTRQLLAYSKRETLTPAPTDLCVVLARLAPMLRRTLGEQVEIRIEQPDMMLCAVVDRHRLEDAILNLCLNARDAMPEGGALTLRARACERLAGAEGRDVAAGFVCIEVVDEGEGMDPAVQARAFDPFFTTKPTGRGSGLGLSMVYGFVRQSGGHIELTTAPGSGTRVRMYLPRTDALPLDDPPRVEPTEHGHHEGRVLVVEDDASVRRMAVRLLEDAGYHVVAVNDGAQALALLQGETPIDVLFSDVVLPGGLNGTEVGERARALRPELPVVYASGYAQRAGGIDPERFAGSTVLHKPYSRRELLDAMATALGRKADPVGP